MNRVQVRRLFLNRVRRVSSGRRKRSTAGDGGQGIVERWSPAFYADPSDGIPGFSGKLAGPPLGDWTVKPNYPQIRVPFLPAMAATRTIESFPADELARGLSAMRTSNRVEEALPPEQISDHEPHQCDKGDPSYP